MDIKHRAKKSLGQNFLQDANIARKIVDSLRIKEDDCVIEIGPGQGALTKHIESANPKRLILLEKDSDLAPKLSDTYLNAEVVETDALKFDWAKLDSSCKWKVVGNLPYNVASKLMWDIAALSPAVECVFMVQHEVAQRVCADEGSKKYGGLTAWIKSFCQTEYLFKVPPTVFKPKPKVDSAVIKFYSLPENEKPQEHKALAKVIKYCFQFRRKQLGKILKSLDKSLLDEWADKEGVKLSFRPEVLTPLQFQSLSKIIKNDFPS